MAYATANLLHFSTPRIQFRNPYSSRTLNIVNLVSPLPSSSSFSISSRQQLKLFRPNFTKPGRKRFHFYTEAYAAAPSSDSNINSEPKPEESNSSSSDTNRSPNVITWGLIWSLMLRHKLRLAISIATLIGCTTCTLSMQIFSGQFFEVLIGARPEPLWKLLSRIGVLYIMEPIFTICFVINMTTIWENVMIALRGRVFRRILIQKAEFFDRYKV
ncbi:ABC transporter B family member 28-like [Papaver somniferum]|uniref:ABC transporter B family member 28-like n=1 Tax=Papaver somniferum TaxID=3469 RepID=UPI000E6FE3E6|nr:ABC transporter B family member 28-like [Papaver somniferum]